MRHLAHEVVADEPSFRDVAEALGLGVPFRMHMDGDGGTRFLRVGASCAAVLGMPAEALLADANLLSEVILPEDHARLLADKTAFAAGRGPSSVEVRARKPTGELRWLRLTSCARPAPDGGRLLDGLIIDVTDSRRMAEQLAEERRRLEQAIELTGAGVFQWDRDDPDTMLWSEHQYAIYGMPQQTPITVQLFRDLIHPEDFPTTHAAAHGSGGDVSLEHRIIRPDGEVRWVLIHLRTGRDADGLKTIHGTTLDVTDRRAAEEWRRLQMREIAHRGKNTLTVLIAMVRQAARSSGTVEELSELLTARLLAMAKSQQLASAADGAPLALRQLVEQVLDVFDLARFDVDPALAGVMLPGDLVTALALLLHELATNAVKYGALSRAEGRVRLSLQPTSEGFLNVEWREVGGPPVEAPTRQGFGTRLLATVLQGHRGAVRPEFALDGFIARIEMPAAWAAAPR